MADVKTEKQKVKEITDKLEEGLSHRFWTPQRGCFSIFIDSNGRIIYTNNNNNSTNYIARI